MIYGGPGFLAHRMILLLPQPLSLLFRSVSSTGDTKEDWERDTTC